MSSQTPYSADSSNSNALIEEFLCKNKNSPYKNEEADLLRHAWAYLCKKCGNKLRGCGSPYYLHPLRVAYILQAYDFDAQCIAAAFLHGVFSLGVSEEELESEFPKAVFELIKSVSKLGAVSAKSNTLFVARATQEVLIALSCDIRAVFIKIADRLDRIRNIKSLESQEQRALASQVSDIWAPLSERLGMQKVKNEFEDEALKYTNPAAFRQIKAIVAEKSSERQAYLNDAVKSVEKEAAKVGIAVSVQSRAKHFYSIYQKMRKRQKSADELFDLFALRILCKKVSDCYTLLGIVHTLWEPIDGRFKDYIAHPKENGYQSLHTTVLCREKPLEVQIRTEAMHDIAENGKASHALYKVASVGGILTSNGGDILVLTPAGDVKHLPLGATAIDFAYAVHSAVGEKIVGAKADGAIISLSTPLKSTQIVEILTNPAAHPTLSQLSLVKTTKAHQKIHSWLAKNDPNFADYIGNATPVAMDTKEVDRPPRHHENKGAPLNNGVAQQRRAVKVDGVSNVAVVFAKCCKPSYPQKIIGYVSSARGVVIHCADCLTYLCIPNAQNRKVEVEWESPSK